MHEIAPLTESQLTALEQLAAGVPGYPWTAYVEGRDMLSGSTFIMTGTDKDGDRHEDLYLSLRDDAGVGQTIRYINHVDFVAELRSLLPQLIAEVRASRKGSSHEVISNRIIDRIGTLENVCDDAPWIPATDSAATKTWIESRPHGGKVSRIEISSYEPLPLSVATLIAEMRNALPSILAELSGRNSL